MKRFGILLLAAALGCTSSASRRDDAAADVLPVATPQPAEDTRVAELQTSLTEMLERIDVLNDRIARLESGAAEHQRVAVATAPPAPAVVREQPVAARVTTPAATAQPAVGPATAPAAAPTAAPAVAGVAPSETGSVSKAMLGAQMAENYRAALMLYGKSRPADARKAFQAVFDADPAGELADNALYWIGETWFAAGNYREAARYYDRVVKEYADQNKAPDAMFKLGVTEEKSGDLKQARQTLESLIQRYPYATAAASARVELKRIKY